MARIATEVSMSLDGYIADEQGGVEQLFSWCTGGPVTVPTHRFPFQVGQGSAVHLRSLMSEVGAVVVGRREFENAGFWNGRHPLDVPVFVVTHNPPADWAYPDAPFTFVTDGVESAVKQASAVAGDRAVGVGPGQIARQCLDAGLLDELRINLVPVVLGCGIPLFDQLGSGPARFEDPVILTGDGVTHLYYQTKR